MVKSYLKDMKEALKLLLILLLTSHFSCSENDETIEKRIDALFSEYNSKTPGVAIGVVKDGELIFKKGYGSSSLEYDVPITPTTVFPMASVSKQFTAFAIYLLESEGKLSLEDDVRKYIPELQDYGTVIKIKHLLAHTSGLRDQYALLTLAGWRMDDVISTRQIMNLALQQKELNFKPGTALGYINTGYTFLAVIIEKITGKSFSEYTKEQIFSPLKMHDSQFYDNYREVVQNRAHPYEKTNDTTYLKQDISYQNVGPTGLYTTVEDLAKWVSNFENPIVGDKKLFDRFNEFSRLNNGEKTVIRIISNGDTLFHAKGQYRRNYRGLKLLSHGGHHVGFRTFLGRFPDKNLSIIALSNDEHYDILEKNFAIAGFYLEDKLLPKKEEKGANQEVANNTSPKTFKNDLKQFEGNYYSNELDTNYNISVKNGKLVMQHRRLSDIALSQSGESEFSGANYFYFQLKFTKEEAVVSGFEISTFGINNMKFKKSSEAIKIEY